MIPLSSLLQPDNVLIGITATSKKRIFEQAAQTLALLYELDKKLIFDALTQRERLGSTYFSNGIAFPHCRLPDLDSPKALLVRLNGTIEGNNEEEATRCFLFLLAPEDSANDHLIILAQAAALFGDEEQCNLLIEASTSEAFSELVVQWSEKNPPDSFG